ncbi:MAG: hypothetical protein JW932_19790 [Deltaproteobacteria bacterium]|nr:hypothetical protein [Deltaproteobacteria bacterium]
MDSIDQSPAGRTGIIKLLPFAYHEIYGNENPDLNKVLYKGFYLRIFDRNIGNLVKSRHPGPVSSTGWTTAGVEISCNYLKRLDSGLHLSACGHAQAGRNDENRRFPTFYKTIHIKPLHFSQPI